jgi:hypothetical protein
MMMVVVGARMIMMMKMGWKNSKQANIQIDEAANKLRFGKPRMQASWT